MTSTSSQYPKHIPRIPYTDPPGTLQTLDIWIPRPLQDSDPSSTIWIIYIHGGAWRDPTQTASTIHPTIAHLPPSTTPHIAAIASLNYRLSPYPSHPTDPSTPSDPQRNATWPSHLQDIDSALQYLRLEYGVGRSEDEGGNGYKWVGIGHSCGATLLLQRLSRISHPDFQPSATDSKTEHGKRKNDPLSLVLLSGIYSLPDLLSAHSPPLCTPEIYTVYRDILTGAFGSDARLWEAVSPVSGDYRGGGTRMVVLGWSAGDQLVEAGQRDAMVKRLEECGWVCGDGEKRVERRELVGGHDEVWRGGWQVAGLIGEVVGRLVGEGW